MIDSKKIRFSIDRGGTFTDIYAEIPKPPWFKIIKLLSVDPEKYEDAPREGIRRILEEVLEISIPKDSIDPKYIDCIRMGTTVATNALLERKGARCALVTTKGFRDILQIGYQNRPDIFDLEIKKPELLYEEVIEIDERIRLLTNNENINQYDNSQIAEGINGERFLILKSPDTSLVRNQLNEIYKKGIRSIAVVFMHGYAWPVHELFIGKIAEEIGFTQISLSCQIMPMAKIVQRGDTTLVDAYLTPHIKDYIKNFRNGFKSELKETKVLFMQSHGGLTNADNFKGFSAILSGPAGGVVGYAMTTYNSLTGQPVIGFDMGGTSTDVSRFGGDYELIHESEISGVRLQSPQMHIKTVASGGSSRLFFDNGMFLVGPESSGSHPGPVCYRKNGFLSITDANLLLGRIQPKYFPKIFGHNNNEALDTEAVISEFTKLKDSINDFYRQKNQHEMSLEEIASGFIKVANEVMIRPIREISVMRGFNIKNHILAVFGGAGPQHACAIARELGISKIFIHRFSGILSAYGIGIANVIVEKQKPSSLIYSKSNLDILLSELSILQKEAEADIISQGFSIEKVIVKRFLNLRFKGTDTKIMIEQPLNLDFAKAFCEQYYKEFGFILKDRDIFVDDIRVRAIGKTEGVKKIKIPSSNDAPKFIDKVACYFDNTWMQTKIYLFDQLLAGQKIDGPSIILNETSTVLIEPYCSAVITDYGDIEINVPTLKSEKIGVDIDPVNLSIFSNLFMSIAEQMGRMLQKTAISTNIKERLDFSCAIFDSKGDLVANAPHLPVHLGSMSDAVKEQIRINTGLIKQGDVFLSNHPMAGGSHLPDITVITPVFMDEKIIFWTASRGHHSDIGGISPGSMPASSKRLEEEGVCIISFKIVESGIFKEDELIEIFIAPSKIKIEEGSPKISGARSIHDNISDIKAQISANQKGIELITEMVNNYGIDVVQAYMGHIQSASEEAVRYSLIELSNNKNFDDNGGVSAHDYLDTGSKIDLILNIDKNSGDSVFDFSGTSYEVLCNLNAPKSITKSAILYALRCLIKKNLPLNSGCLIPITVKIKKGSILDPSFDAAVAGGNVITSQRIVDVILKAFGTAAASQGCMNNFTFGNNTFAYYETIGGGAGAGPSWHGQSGVHTHMTNTRITDPEILEKRYPVVLIEFSIRKNSGGNGQYKGGDGLIREIEFLEPLNISILSDRRVFAPYGLLGGESGMRGINFLIKKGVKIIDMGGKNEVKVEPFDRIKIMTPGGGGYGKIIA
ncbi:MAG: hydantoinase B/oxoprolinase family protein [Desulfobacterales bacterium]|nr:hydantoinase B/oxoprolinase family protein [Desulfobacterales bacterium]